MRVNMSDVLIALFVLVLLLIGISSGVLAQTANVYDRQGTKTGSIQPGQGRAPSANIYGRDGSYQGKLDVDGAGRCCVFYNKQGVRGGSVRPR